jgi:hypothetical protein
MGRPIRSSVQKAAIEPTTQAASCAPDAASGLRSAEGSRQQHDRHKQQTTAGPAATGETDDAARAEKGERLPGRQQAEGKPDQDGDRARKLACCRSLKRRWSTLDRLDGPARAARAADLFNDCGEPLFEFIEILEEVLFRQNCRNNMHCLKLVDLVLRKSDNKYL